MAVQIYHIIVVLQVAIIAFLVYLWRQLRHQGSEEERSRELLELKNQFLETFSKFLQETTPLKQEVSALKELTRSFQEYTFREFSKLHQNVERFSNLENLFRSPKLRGRWGEATLEYMLSNYFSPDHFKMQYTFPSGEIVDAVITLPNKKLLPIDAKFPLENFSKMMESEREEDRERFRKLFIEDVKRKIDEVSRKYILPQHNTLEFALLYIPAEQIYYEIAFNIKEEDLLALAWKKRVVLTSPNTLYPTLYVIKDWIRDVHLSEATQEILKRLQRLTKDATSLAETFQKFKKHLHNAFSSLEELDKRVSLFVHRSKALLESQRKEGIIERSAQGLPFKVEEDLEE